ncbi:MAG: hypothetical protein F6K17_38620, partial [Okeania sp. SIO3C4]|nr:hypothetical protein [Okeania sp. SIO3C4]
MLPIENRLRHYKDFGVVYQKGIRKNTSYLALKALRHQQEPKLPQGADNLESLRPTRIGNAMNGFPDFCGELPG